MALRLYHRFNLALSFLTLFKLPERPQAPFDPRDLAASLAWFPLIGALIGTLLVATAAIAVEPLGPLPVAAWLAVLSSLITRGLHLDGLADCADGFGGAYEPAQRLRIMKDSRVGAFGVIALVLDLVLKIVLLAALLERGHPDGIYAAFCLSRLAMVLAAATGRYARAEGGLGQPFLDQARRRDGLTAALLAVLLTAPVVRLQLVAQLLGLLLTVAAVRGLSNRALGGITGDVLGAVNELTELTALSCALWLS